MLPREWGGMGGAGDVVPSPFLAFCIGFTGPEPVVTKNVTVITPGSYPGIPVYEWNN